MPDTQPNPRHVLCDLLPLVENCGGPGGKPGPCSHGDGGSPHIGISAAEHAVHEQVMAARDKYPTDSLIKEHAEKAGHAIMGIRRNEIARQNTHGLPGHEGTGARLDAENEGHRKTIASFTKLAGITHNSNPEGHNQYTGKGGTKDHRIGGNLSTSTTLASGAAALAEGHSTHADAASAAARHSSDEAKTKAGHESAATAHDTAASAHMAGMSDASFGNSPNEHVSGLHHEAAKAHTTAAEAHRLTAKSVHNTEDTSMDGVENCGGMGGKPGPCGTGGGSSTGTSLRQKINAASAASYAARHTSSSALSASTRALQESNRATEPRAAKGDHLMAAQFHEQAAASHESMAKTSTGGTLHAKAASAHRDVAAHHRAIHSGASLNTQFPLTKETFPMVMPMTPAEGDGAAASALTEKAAKTNLPADHQAAAALHRNAAAYHQGAAGDHEVAAGGDAMTSNARSEAADFLITNSCGCWTENDRSLLASMDESRLSALRANAEQHQRDAVILNSLRGEGLVVNGVHVRVDSDDAFIGEFVANDGNRPDFKSLLRDYGTPQEKEVWNAAVQVHAAERKLLVDKLVANASVSQRQAAAEVYADLPMPKLRHLVAAIPAKQPARTPAANQAQRPVVRAPNYGAAGVGPGAAVINAAGDNVVTDRRDEPLGLPKMMFANPLKS